MAIYASYKKKDYNPAPEGLWQGVCCDVIDLGLVKNTYDGGEKHMVKVRWQLEERDQKTGKPFEVSKRYNLSLHEKANLRKDLESWRGRKFTEAELEKFDLEKLLGANCQLSVSHNIKEEGDVYANVNAIVPIRGSQPKLRVTEDYVRQADRQRSNGNGGNGEREPGADEGEGPCPF
jgi:hypothetical protein